MKISERFSLNRAATSLSCCLHFGAWWKNPFPESFCAKSECLCVCSSHATASILKAADRKKDFTCAANICRWLQAAAPKQLIGQNHHLPPAARAKAAEHIRATQMAAGRAQDKRSGRSDGRHGNCKKLRAPPGQQRNNNFDPVTNSCSQMWRTGAGGRLAKSAQFLRINFYLFEIAMNLIFY